VLIIVSVFFRLDDGGGQEEVATVTRGYRTQGFDLFRNVGDLLVLLSARGDSTAVWKWLIVTSMLIISVRQVMGCQGV